jgi:hypothetical protein
LPDERIEMATASSELDLSTLFVPRAVAKKLDINPLLVFPEGQGAAVLDARVCIG